MAADSADCGAGGYIAGFSPDLPAVPVVFANPGELKVRFHQDAGSAGLEVLSGPVGSDRLAVSFGRAKSARVAYSVLLPHFLSKSLAGFPKPVRKPRPVQSSLHR